MELSVEEIEKIKKILEKVYDDDQKFRSSINSSEIVKKYGINSKEVKEILDNGAKLDAINLEIIKDIIKNYGWLGEKTVGFKANMALFLVIQHADLETQLQYLPIMEQAAREGNLRLKEYATYIDRIEIRQGRKQIYGTQVKYNEEIGCHQVLPILNPEEVDERRKEVGLNTMQEQLAFYGIDWEQGKTL